MTWVIRNGSPTYVREEDVKSSDKKFGESNRVTAEIVTEKPKSKKKAKKTSE